MQKRSKLRAVQVPLERMAYVSPRIERPLHYTMKEEDFNELSKSGDTFGPVNQCETPKDLLLLTAKRSKKYSLPVIRMSNNWSFPQVGFPSLKRSIQQKLKAKGHEKDSSSEINTWEDELENSVVHTKLYCCCIPARKSKNSNNGEKNQNFHGNFDL